MIDQVLDALAARDPGALQGARYTENGVDLPLGEGLWATADSLGRYRHMHADSETGQAAAFATVSEGGTRSILALRTKTDQGRVQEIEAVVARPPLFGGGGAFGDGPGELDRSGAPSDEWFVELPPQQRMSREALRDVADLYFAGLERNDGQGDYPFADDCIRIENGFRTTDVPVGAGDQTPYVDTFRSLSAKQQFETGFFRFVTRIRERRFPVIDPTRGVVFAFAFFDHDGTVRDYALSDGTPRRGIERPFSWMIAEAFRIENGLLRLIEAIMTEVPYGMRSGWPLAEGDIA